MNIVASSFNLHTTETKLTTVSPSRGYQSLPSMSNYEQLRRDIATTRRDFILLLRESRIVAREPAGFLRDRRDFDRQTAVRGRSD